MPRTSRPTDLHVLLDRLDAGLIAVPLDDPLDAETPVAGVGEYLTGKEFDLALVDVPELLIVRRRTVEARSAEAAELRLREIAEVPRRSRLIDADLAIRGVVAAFADDSEPLLVVGAGGVTHIITVADFAGVAGTAIVLTALTVLDAEIDAYLQADLNRGRDAWNALGEKQKRDAEERYARAQRLGTELTTLAYASFSARLHATQAVGWPSRARLATHELNLVAGVRNKTAHGEQLSDPQEALAALRIALRLLGSLSQAA